MDNSDVPSQSAELVAALKTALRHQIFEAGRLLTEMSKLKEGAYGKWQTFDNIVLGELRISPRHAYRLMFAHQMKEFFKEHGRPLPISESQVRPLSRLRTDKQRVNLNLTLTELRLKCWEIAFAMKQRASTPSVTDVSRAVSQLMAPTPDPLTDETFRDYRSHVHRIRSEMTKMTKLLGELRWFLNYCHDDPRAKRQKKDMAKMLGDLLATLDKHYGVFIGRINLPDDKLAAKVATIMSAIRERDIARAIEAVDKIPPGEFSRICWELFATAQGEDTSSWTPAPASVQLAPSDGENPDP